MKQFVKLTRPMAAGLFLVTGAALMAWVACAADPNAENKATVTRHITTMGEACAAGGLGGGGGGFTNPKGLATGNNSYSPSSFSSSTGHSDLRKMHDAAFRDECGTNNVSTNVVAVTNSLNKAKAVAKAKDPAKGK